MKTQIASHTAENNDYPAFVNVSKTPPNNYCNGKISITVREQGHPERSGDMAEIVMSQSDFARILDEMNANFKLDLHDPNQQKLDV